MSSRSIVWRVAQRCPPMRSRVPPRRRRNDRNCSPLRGMAGIDYQGLKNPQHELDKTIHIVIGNAHAAPVDIEPLKQGAPEELRSIGGDSSRESAGLAGGEQQTQITLMGQALQCVGNLLDYGLDRIVDVLEVIGEMVKKGTGLGD